MTRRLPESMTSAFPGYAVGDCLWNGSLAISGLLGPATCHGMCEFRRSCHRPAFFTTKPAGNSSGLDPRIAASPTSAAGVSRRQRDRSRTIVFLLPLQKRIDGHAHSLCRRSSAGAPSAESLSQILRQSYRCHRSYRLPGTSGDAAIVAIRQLFPDTPVIVLSGFITREEARAALIRGVAGVISKDKDIEGGDDPGHHRRQGPDFGLTAPFPLPLSIPLTAERVRALNLSHREIQVAGLLVE